MPTGSSKPRELCQSHSEHRISSSNLKKCSVLNKRPIIMLAALRLLVLTARQTGQPDATGAASATMTVTSVGPLAVTPEDFPGVLGSTPCAYPLRLLLAVAALPPGSVAEPESRGALEWSAASVRLPATGKCAIHLQMAALHFAGVYRDSDSDST